MDLCVGCETQQGPNQLPPAVTPATPTTAEEIPLKSSASKTTPLCDAGGRQRVSRDVRHICLFFLFLPAKYNDHFANQLGCHISY